MVNSNFISFIIICLISSFIGLTVVKIVDYRLSDIAIKMPAITLPPQHITIKIDDSVSIIPEIQFRSKTALVKPLNSRAQYNTLSTLTQQGGATDDQICKKDLLPPRTEYNKNNYKSESRAVVNVGKTPPDSSDHLSRPAPYPRAPQTTTEPPRSGRGESYYKDTAEMTPEQIIKFKNKANFYNMTLLDYTNWLNMFQSEPEKLSGFHRSNLRILLRGGELQQNDMPRSMPLPRKSDHEYNEKTSRGTFDNIPQPEYLGYKAHNYEDQIGAVANKNRSLTHLAFINPDEPMKTWILTRQPVPLKGKKAPILPPT